MLSRRAVSALLIPATLLSLSGCTTAVWINPTDLRPEEGNKVEAVREVDGDYVFFDSRPPCAVESDTVHAMVESSPYQIALDQVQGVKVNRPDAGKNTALVLSILGAGLVVALVIAIASSWEGFDFGSDWNYTRSSGS